jgi:UDP-N-acetylmuramate--alanine ligase
VFEGHAAEQVDNTDVVVISSAVPAGNPEVVAARERQLPIIPRAEMLAELMRMKVAVAVAGSHGKTTTTSMTSVLLDHAGLDPTTVIGGRVATIGGGARVGKSDILVAEADESDRTFLRLLPVLAVVTGIDREHLDAYEGMEDLVDSFLRFINMTPFYGGAIVCIDDANVRSLLPRIRRRVITYGLSPDAEISAEGISISEEGTRYELRIRGGLAGAVQLRQPGRTAVLNSLAAAAVGLEFGLGTPAIRNGLEAFSGVERRFQMRGTVGGIRIVDDYAHHPSEIRETLEAARSAFSARTVAVFQPHRYSRVRDLHGEFCRAFGAADIVVVTDIYPAGETPIPGVSGEGLAEGIRDAGHPDARFVGSLEEVARALAPGLRDGDVVLTLGAGSITQLPDLLQEVLRERVA